MYKHIFLNPFYWYSFIWSTVLCLSLFRFSDAYGAVSTGVALFFLATIVISAVVGYFFAKQIKKIKLEYKPPRHMWICVGLIVAGFMADFVYGGSIPLLDELTKSDRTYMDFQGIPVLHVAIFTYAFYYAVNMFYHFLEEKNFKKRIIYLGVVGVICALYLCLYNRAVLMMLGVIFVVLVLSYMKRIRAWHIGIVAVIGIIGLYLFGVMGNIRSGDVWYSSAYLFDVAQIDPKRWPSFIPTPFAWTWAYMVTPIGNLSHLAENFNITWDLEGVMSCIFPDSLSNRLYGEIPKALPLVIKHLNVSSAFATPYKFGGYFGMAALFLYSVVFGWVLLKLSMIKPQNFMVINGITVCVFVFSFFGNFFNYTGLIFSLVYPLIPVAFFLAKNLLAVLKKRKENKSEAVESTEQSE